MSQPKRYNIIWTVKAEDPEMGVWVEWDDYAALAAENERRTEQLNQSMAMTDSCIENINRLTAENERLRKAGDAMYSILERVEDNPYGPAPYGGDSMDAWLAAKEGRDAK